VLGTVPKLGAAETRRAIEAANRAWPAWRAKTGKERANILRTWYDLIMANQEDLAILMTMEQGKPLAESRGEIVYGASFVEWFAEEAKRVYGDTIPQHQPDKRIVVIKQPIGVVAAITPWNFPNAMITRKCAPALAAGCPVVIKPATATPYSAYALAELADRAGLPAGILNVVTGASGATVRRDREEGLHGARRQRALPGVRRRRSRRRRRGRHDVQVPQRRPNLRLRQPHPGAGHGLRCLRGQAGDGSESAHRRLRPGGGRAPGPADRPGGG
jgi:hypothetical protein